MQELESEKKHFSPYNFRKTNYLRKVVYTYGIILEKKNKKASAFPIAAAQRLHHDVTFAFV